MDEAQELADRVAIIVAGRIVAEGAPSTLSPAVRGRTSISFRLPERAELPKSLLEEAEVRDGTVVITPEAPIRALHELTGWALEHGMELDGLRVVRPTLEDVYLELTKGEPAHE
jgi:ABC-2 type transport system ATP-binding protein